MKTRKQLIEENEHYKRIYTLKSEECMSWFNDYCDQVLKNGQLIKDNKTLTRIVDIYSKDITKLLDENRKMKQELLELKLKLNKSNLKGADE